MALSMDTLGDTRILSYPTPSLLSHTWIHLNCAARMLGGESACHRFRAPVGDGPGLSLATPTVRVPIRPRVSDTSWPAASGPTPAGVPVAMMSFNARATTE